MIWFIGLPSGPCLRETCPLDQPSPRGDADFDLLEVIAWKARVFTSQGWTINKLKLSSRTVRLVHREAEASLLALRVLLAHADLASREKETVAGPVISPRKVLIEIRRELNGTATKRQGNYAKRLGGCRAGSRKQKSAKACRD